MTGTRKGGMVADIRIIGASLAVAVLLSGCINLGGKVPEQLISLTPEQSAPVGDMGSGNIAESLIVLDPDTDRRLDVQRVPVQVNDSTVAYLKDAMWVERPARQFRRLLAETLRARSKRLIVEGNDIEVAGKAVLSGRLVDMGYDARSRSVVVRYDALLESADGTIRSHRFESVVPDVSPKADAVASALNQAANDTAVQVTDWVG